MKRSSIGGRGGTALCTIAVFSLSLLLFTQTSLPGIGDGDSALYVRMSHSLELGIRPYEHPLYVLLNRLFLIVPGEGAGWIAGRITLASNVYGALAAAAAFLLCLAVTGSRPASLIAAIAFSLSHTFWWVGTTTEVYTLQILLTILILLLLHVYHRRSSLPHALAAFYLLGLGLAVHAQLVILLVPSFGFFLCSLRGDRLKSSMASVLATMLGFSFYLILILQAHCVNSGGGVVDSLTGDYFRGAIFSINPGLNFLMSTAEFLVSFLLQYNPVYLAAGIHAIVLTRSAGGRFHRLIVVFCLLNTLFVLNYPVMDRIFFHLPVYMLFMLAIAKGTAHWLAHALPGIREGRRILWIVLIVLTIAPLASRSWEYLIVNNIMHKRLAFFEAIGLVPPIPHIPGRDDLAYFILPDKHEASFSEFYRDVLEMAPPDAVIVDDWIHGYPIMRDYFQEVEKLRPDVQVLRWFYFLGSDEEKAAFVEKIAGMMDTRRIFLTTTEFPEDDFVRRLKEKVDVCVEPWEDIWEITRCGKAR